MKTALTIIYRIMVIILLSLLILQGAKIIRFADKAQQVFDNGDGTSELPEIVVKI